MRIVMALVLAFVLGLGLSVVADCVRFKKEKTSDS